MTDAEDTMTDSVGVSDIAEDIVEDTEPAGATQTTLL